MSMDGRIVLFGNGSHENLGCQAIDIGTAIGLSECGFSELTFMPARLPFAADVVSRASGLDVRLDTSLAEGLQATRSRVARKIARGMPASVRPGLIRPFIRISARGNLRAALALGGDNYTFDYGPPDVFFAVNRQFVDSGVPLMMWGASIGPFDVDPDYERMATRELRSARRIFVREDATRGYLSGLGLDSMVFRMSDPAFLMPGVPTEIAGFESGFERIIGVNLSPLIGRKLGLTPAEWRGECVRIMERLLAETDLEIVLVAHVTVADGDDRALLETVRDGLAATSRPRVRILPEGLDAQQIKWAIGQMEAFVGARTHATIAAMSQGVPTISLGYSAKAAGVNHDVLGHDDWVIGFDVLSADTLSARVERLLAARETVSRELREALPRVRERSRNGFAQLIHDIDAVGGWDV